MFRYLLTQAKNCKLTSPNSAKAAIFKILIVAEQLTSNEILRYLPLALCHVEILYLLLELEA